MQPHALTIDRTSGPISRSGHFIQNFLLFLCWFGCIWWPPAGKYAKQTKANLAGPLPIAHSAYGLRPKNRFHTDEFWIRGDNGAISSSNRSVRHSMDGWCFQSTRSCRLHTFRTRPGQPIAPSISIALSHALFRHTAEWVQPSIGRGSIGSH